MNLIVAVDKKWGIGKDNKLLAHIPEDLKFFAEKTRGKAVIMGKKTFESLPNGALPNRENIVLTTNGEFCAENVQVCCDVNEALEVAGEDAFVIGGASVYAQMLEFCNTAYITKIDAEFDADAFMVNLDERSEWEISEEGEWDESGGLRFKVDVYKKIG